MKLQPGPSTRDTSLTSEEAGVRCKWVSRVLFGVYVAGRAWVPSRGVGAFSGLAWVRWRGVGAYSGRGSLRDENVWRQSLQLKNVYDNGVDGCGYLRPLRGLCWE